MQGCCFAGGSGNPPEGLKGAYHEGFVGCIDTVFVNRRPLNLVTDRENFNPLNHCDA
jgi:hypothetical protein